MSKFIHLNIHSEYSVVDSTLGIKKIVALAKDNKQPAIAVVDHVNMYALVKFYNTATYAGVKPLLGANVYVEDASGEVFKIICLCQNEQGYLNLSYLISKAFLKNQRLIDNKVKPLIKTEWLAEKNAGLIVLSGGREGDVGQAILSQDPNKIAGRVKWWLKYFPDRFYLELIRTGRNDEKTCIIGAINIAQQYNLPVVATNDVRFQSAEDFEAHEVRVCIHDGYILDDPNRPKNYSEEQFFRSSTAMIELFADIPEAITNTLEIAKRCNVDLTLGEYFLPAFPIPDGMSEAQYFIQLANDGLDERLNSLFTKLSVAEFAQNRIKYAQRLKFELDIIIKMGFPGYFFIVADFIRWSKEQKIPVGPGRGSGAGSLVAYCLKITDLDPIEYDLLFERFLNPERLSMPDFDIDFCMDRREEVINYVYSQYGKDHVSQIVTFGTMAAKAVIRDVGRVLGLGYGLVDSIAKLIPNDLGIKLSSALEQEEMLQEKYDNDDDIRTLLDLALKLEGTVRNTGKHAGGVVISPKPLYEFCPVQCEIDGTNVLSQLDKDDVEAVGLVKFDFLGLRTLTIIDWALQSINRGKKLGDEGFIEIEKIPLIDKKVFDLIKTGKTTGVFQLESSGMQNLIVRLKPDCFEDIIALVALFRPGPLESGMVDNFIARKHGKEKVSYPDAQYQHLSLKDTLEPTYGIILYQEQVMQIAQILSGYTLGEADMLRRAMGKKKLEEMAKQRSIFEQGAINNNVDGSLAMKIFDLVEKFAGYGFNKSHSAAYALVSYQSAWLKTHYPAEFMAAQLSSDMDSTDKVVNMINECYYLKLTVEVPDINQGQIHFKPIANAAKLTYGLGAIKGAGEAVLENIINERNNNGAYKDLFDFCYRVKKVNKRVLEALILAGAFDKLQNNRTAMVASIALALQKADQKYKDEAAGQADLFGDITVFTNENVNELIVIAAESEKIKLKQEKKVLGLYLTGHPIDSYEQELKKLVNTKLIDLVPEKWDKKWVAGLIVESRNKVTKTGKRMGFVTLDDKTARLDIVLRPTVFESAREIIDVDKIVLFYGEVAEDTFNGGIKLDAEKVVTLAEYRVEKARAIKILSYNKVTTAKIHELQNILLPFRSDEGLPLVIDFQNDQAKAQLRTANNYSFFPEDELLENLKHAKWRPSIVF